MAAESTSLEASLCGGVLRFLIDADDDDDAVGGGAVADVDDLCEGVREALADFDVVVDALVDEVEGIAVCW